MESKNLPVWIIAFVIVIMGALYISSDEDMLVADDSIAENSASTEETSLPLQTMPAPVAQEPIQKTIEPAKQEMQKREAQQTIEKETPQLNNRDIEPSYDRELAKRIGNRPEQIDHIVSAPSNYNVEEGGHFEVSPGLNPSLFRSAGFKEGDVLQSINGLDLADPNDYRTAKDLIAHALTLEFKVNRNGRTVILYLDRPSRDLTIQ